MDQSDTLTYRYRLKLTYDGGPFHGWQIQSSDMSLQELLKKALQTVLRDPSIHPVASGRTDAGVHAKAQIVHFDTIHKDLDFLKTLRSLNGLLPVQARVLAIESCSKLFHARYSAIGKTYHYHIQTGPVEDPFFRQYRWHVYQKIDKDLLLRACKSLEGRHDFKALASENHKGTAAHDSIRTIKRVEPHFINEHLRIEFEGDGFLYKMVRNSVGLIIEIAKGACPFEKLENVLNNPQKAHGGYCAPAHGLILYKVLYDTSFSPSEVLEL